MTDDERAVAAGEYVLGTLPPAERAAFAASVAVDRLAAEAVRFWERALAPLAATIAAEAPPASVWAAILARISGERAANDPGLPAPAAAPGPGAWRGIAVAASLLAAALLAWNVVQRPAREPAPAPVIATAPAPPNVVSVAALNAGGAKAGLLLTVDEATGVILARPVDLAPRARRDLQLWWIEGTAAPRPVGLLDPAQARRFRLPTASFAGTTFAISVEPVGGSPTGAPTGPIIFSGEAVRLPQT